MKAIDLSKKLVESAQVSEALKQLSTLSKKAIAKQGEDASQVLENCNSFCSKAASNERYEQVVHALQFILKANQDDTWLTEATQIILPSLPSLYSLVLRLSDPDKRTSPQPGLISMAITPAVQKSAQALRVLCRIYDLCLDFCEVDWAEGSNHLRLLAGAAAAALFGSYYQSERDTLHDTAYAMDELARISSFALSHILLSKSSIIPDATKILGNRIPSLLTVLFFAPELSIQRSIILVLRLLHDHAGDLECNVHGDLQRKIENGLSDTRFGNGAGLQVFKEFDVQSDTSETQAELIIAKMLDEVDIISKCFTCNCTVQMKGKVNGRTKKGGSVKAQVDWNKNSIVVHVKNQAPAYFPFHNISTMKWMSGHKEVRLGFRSNSELSDTQLTVRFGPGNRAFLGRAIENRIEQVISSVSQKHSSVDHTEALHPLRKASVSYHMFNTFGTTSSCEDDDQDCTDQESDVFERSDVQCEADDVVPRKENDGSYSESITGRSPVKQVPPNKDSGGALETSRPSRGRKTARNVGVKQKCHSPASGITEEAQDYGESQERSPTPSSQCRMDADGAHVSLPRVCAGNEKKCAPDSTLARDMEICADIDITKRRKTAEDGDTHRHAKLTQSNLDACEELRRSSSEQSIASTPPDIVSNQLAKSEDIGSDTHESGDIVMSISEKPKVAKPVRNERKLPSMTFKQHTGFQKKAVASSNNSGSESTVVSIQSSRINSSETKFSAADERVRIKLLCVVHEVTKARQKKASLLAAEKRRDLQHIRTARAKEDRELVGKFTTVLKKQAAAQCRRIAQYKAQKLTILNAAKGRVVKLRNSVDEALKKMKNVKATSKRELSKARRDMDRVRDRLVEELQRCITESETRKNSRAKTDSLFQGLAKLFRTS